MNDIVKFLLENKELFGEYNIQYKQDMSEIYLVKKREYEGSQKNIPQNQLCAFNETKGDE